MPCLLCRSDNRAEFPAELNIHFPRVKNLDKPSVWAFPKMLISLDCGFTQFTISKAELSAWSTVLLLGKPPGRQETLTRARDENLRFGSYSVAKSSALIVFATNDW